MIGAGVSNSMYNKMASREEAFVAALVEARPFSTMGPIVLPRVLSLSAHAHIMDSK